LEEKLGREVAPWVLHSSRHTVATHLREDLHVSQDVVARILAHAPPGTSDTTAIYDRSVLLRERRAALVAWRPGWSGSARRRGGKVARSCPWPGPLGSWPGRDPGLA